MSGFAIPNVLEKLSVGFEVLRGGHPGLLSESLIERGFGPEPHTLSDTFYGQVIVIFRFQTYNGQADAKAIDKVVKIAIRVLVNKS